MRELRIHGVGGPQEERLLGVLSPEDLAVATLGEGTRIVRRRAVDDGVEGYSWGGLTSSSRNAAGWVLYLPFSLINGAGWAAPRGWSGRVHSALAHLLALTATASYVVWTGFLLVDLVGFQWRNRLRAVDVVKSNGWLNGAVEYAMPVLCAAVFALLVFAFFALMNRRSPTEALSKHDDDGGGWKKDETFSPVFFQHRSRERLLWLLHILLAGAGVAIVVGLAIDRRDTACQLWLGELVVGVGLAQGAIVSLLWLTALLGRTRPVGAAIATLGAVMANAAFAGVALLATKFLSGYPGGIKNRLVKGGPELGLTSTFFWSLVVGVVLMSLAALHFYAKPIDDGDLPPPVDADINAPVHGLTELARKNVLRARRLARLAHCSLIPVCFLMFAFVVGGAVYLFLCGIQDDWPFDHRHGYHSTNWTDWIGGIVLTALPALTALAFRRAATSVKDRRTLGIIWDVMLIWPRRYHPLAVPPYAANATAELRKRILHHLDEDPKLLVSAHSQGSALSFIALRALADSPDKPKLEQVWYLTYGSHLNGIYAMLFPRHFHNVAIAELKNSVADWRNYWRRTDPIGAPIILANQQPYLGELVPGDDALPDTICPDPPLPPPVGWNDPAGPYAPLERDRSPWLELGIHSHYLAEPALKTWVLTLPRTYPPAPPGD
jgi:hypothetical protein